MKVLSFDDEYRHKIVDINVSAETVIFEEEIFDLTAGDIANEYVEVQYDILDPHAMTQMFPAAGPEQHYGLDFTVINDSLGNPRRISWSTFELSNILVEGDQLLIIYRRNVE